MLLAQQPQPCWPAGALEPRLLRQIFHDEASDRLEFLGRISDAEGSLVRTFFSPAHIRAASQVWPWFSPAATPSVPGPESSPTIYAELASHVRMFRAA